MQKVQKLNPQRTPPLRRIRKELPPPLQMKLRITNHQKAHKLPLPLIRKQTEQAARILSGELPSLEEIHIHLVGTRTIARIHADFLQDPTPTDVITFDHGEIFICPAIAEKQRSQENLSLHHEVLTYMIHGLLHLCGQDDLTPQEFDRMRKRQSKILKSIT